MAHASLRSEAQARHLAAKTAGRARPEREMAAPTVGKQTIHTGSAVGARLPTGSLLGLALCAETA
eukprot:15177608-Alexandrium_andersonii.AAC.1